MRRAAAGPILLLLLFLAACSGDDAPSGTYRLPSSALDETSTAYIAEVVAAPVSGEEHLVIRNHAEIRVDMGGWWIEDSDGNRLPLGIGRQIDADGELRVHPGAGTDDEDDVYAGLEGDILDDDGDELVLRDSAGGEVMRFSYP